MTFADQIDKKRMPKHIAIIMDGNGRWAKERGHERSYGHAQGVDVVRKITDASSRLGIQYLTLYAFSTENWNRPQEEVNILMSLIVSAIEREYTYRGDLCVNVRRFGCRKRSYPCSKNNSMH